MLPCCKGNFGKLKFNPKSKTICEWEIDAKYDDVLKKCFEDMDQLWQRLNMETNKVRDFGNNSYIGKV
jgi:hypothetical protein